jgi:hypothetical protein
MKTPTNKGLLSISVILLLTLSLTIAGLSIVNAQQPVGIPTPTFPFVVAAPNPIGVGQQVLVDFWLSIVPPTSGGGFTAPIWHGFSVTITHPDGTTETRGPVNSDAVGSAFFYYTPTTAGNYTFKMHYAGGDYFTGFSLFGAFYNNTYLASDSPPYVLTVQQQPLSNPYTPAPLPTEYWTRPINGLNTNWGAVSGNWLMAGWNTTARSFDSGVAYTPEGTAPNSAHVLWTKPMTFGGLVGGTGTNSYTSFTDGRSYEEYLTPPVIISGRLYYNSIAAEEPASSGNLNTLGIICVDMSNGQTIFTIPNATLSFGEIYTYNSPNQAGALAYLWTSTGGFGSPTTWNMYDAWTGNYILSMAPVPTGITTIGSDGSIITYSVANNMLTKWNSSAVAGQLLGTSGTNSWQWRPYTQLGRTLNATTGIMWSVPLQNVPGQNISPSFIQNGLFVGNAILTQVGITQFFAYSMDDGHFLWNSTLNPPVSNPPALNALTGLESFENTGEWNGVYYSFIKSTLQWIAYDIQSGQVKWVTNPYTNPFAMYVPSFNQAYGKFYSGGFEGMVTAWDIATGKQVWQFYTGNAGTLLPYGTWPIYSGLTIADGKVFATTGDHGNGVQPWYPGEAIYAINATTGQNIWNMTGWFQWPNIADGKIVVHNNYDNQIYCFGKGPTATTVTAPNIAVSLGTAVQIQGTVTDQSPGAKGSPAIADQDMSAWMAYYYEQQPLLGHITGVPVTLTALDPNGNTQNIGTVTSDAAGLYHIMWTPPVPGEYTIVASFGGSESYFGSYAETAMAVGPAPHPVTTTPPPVTTPPSTSTPQPTSTVSPSVAPTPTQPASSAAPSMTLYIVVAVVAIIIVVAAAAVVLSRRKK